LNVYLQENEWNLMDEKPVRVLVADDERPIRRYLSASLSGQYTVLEAATGEETLAVTVSGRPDVIILDLGLPDVDGVEVTRRLREWTQVPIIVVSVRDREEDKIAALDAGADDYLTKPFGAGELMARLRVALRHSTLPESEPVYQAGGLMVDLARREVAINGQPISLTPTEYDILRILIQHGGKVLTHQQLVHAVWGTSYEADAHLLRVNISNLRRKIEVDPARPQHIVTEPGVGYRLRIYGNLVVNQEPAKLLGIVKKR
jgi:two-component system KDP operon response regulator KdpE